MGQDNMWRLIFACDRHGAKERLAKVAGLNSNEELPPRQTWGWGARSNWEVPSTKEYLHHNYGPSQEEEQEGSQEEV